MAAIRRAERAPSFDPLIHIRIGRSKFASRARRAQSIFVRLHRGRRHKLEPALLAVGRPRGQQMHLSQMNRQTHRPECSDSRSSHARALITSPERAPDWARAGGASHEPARRGASDARQSQVEPGAGCAIAAGGLARRAPRPEIGPHPARRPISEMCAHERRPAGRPATGSKVPRRAIR